MPSKIGFIGCRVRPFMENAFLHGYEVRAVDGFNDWDAARFGKMAFNGSNSSNCFQAVFNRYPAFGRGVPVIFCGPVEADPSLIENALKELTVLNAPASAVATCRSVAFLEEMAVDTLRFPKVGFDKNHDDCKYLIKEFSSAGGVGVRDDDGKNLRGGRYRQRVINGFSIGASFLTVSKDGVYATRLMGLAGHIGRVEEFGQRDYLYGGLAYPASVDSTISETIRRFGERAAAASSLVGWWGADFIVNENAYLLEINPRFTASMELIADAHGIDLVGTQISAINGVMFNGGAAQAEGCRATAVCYAKDDFIFNGAREWFDLGARDIPHDGNIIKKGEPIISLYARAGSCDECMRILKEQAAKLYIKG